VHISPRRRVVRFAITGGLAGMLQLLLLKLLVDGGVPAIPANAAAFLLAAQFNFLMSMLYTWRDRRRERALGRRWIAFHGSIAGMAVLNMLVFGITRQILPDLVASAAGIAAGACGNFLLGDRLVFRAAGIRASQPNDGLRRLPAA
jgi:putative flippase GtrA